MNKMRWFAFAAVVILGSYCLADDVTVEAIFGKVTAAYSSMQTYKAEGTVTADIDIGAGKTTMTTESSMVLKKPNLYRISWA
jgi:outer membrane lipoprotein-sorting protein